MAVRWRASEDVIAGLCFTRSTRSSAETWFQLARLLERLDFFCSQASKEGAAGAMRLAQLRCSRDFLAFCLLGSSVFITDMDCEFFIPLALEDRLHFVERIAGQWP
jgi:hypothetical protein